MKKTKRVGPFKDLYRQLACQANQLAAGIYTAADTQRGLESLTLLESGKYSEIVSASIDPRDYSSADTFSRDYLCVELMSKFPAWDIGIDRTAVALEKFAEVELVLSRIKCFRNFCFAVDGKSTTMHAVLETARRKIQRILGDLDLDEMHLSFAFGPGASTSLSRRRGDAAYKFGAQRPHLTYGAIPFADALKRMHPLWVFEPVVVEGSRLVTVPKNAKTDRTICIEPDLNMYFQKGLGRVIRNRLRRWGLLLPDSQQYNAELAREGSANGRLATVDLSSASDSIHMDLVRELLPPDWVTAVEQLRCNSVILPSGEKHLLRKVSSMGNGFTFELETLIFYAVSTAVIDLLAPRGADHRCTVYGDDIVIAVELVPVLEDIFGRLGFSLNRKKTFFTGPFRESCGKHYFSGTDVSPFYVKSPIDSVLRMYWAANTIRRYSRLSWGLDGRWKPVYDRLVEAIPPFFRDFKIPEGYGDGGLLADWDEVRPSRANDQCDAWLYQCIIPRNEVMQLDSVGTLLKCLHNYGLQEERPRGSASGPVFKPIPNGWEVEWNDLPDDPGERADRPVSYIPQRRGYKRKTLLAQRWPSFGPWLGA